MKKTIHFLLLTFMLSAFMSCRTDDKIVDSHNESSLNNKILVVTLPKNPNSSKNGGVQYTGKFLSFETLEDFQKTYDSLEQSLESNAQYIKSKVGIVTDEDQIDAKFAQYNLDEFKPLIDFENQYNFTSLRKHLQQAEKNWLAIQGDVVDDNDPDNHFIIDETLRTLLNENSEVMIAGNIIRLEDWGEIEILNQDLSAYYKQYSSSDPDSGENYNKMNTNTDAATPWATCKRSTDYTQRYYPDTRRMYKIQSAMQGTAFLRNNRIIAETKYYKKVLGVWIQKRADLYVKLQGTAGHNCSNAYATMSIYKEKSEYAGSVQVKFVNPAPYYLGRDLSIKDNSLFSTHKLWGANQKIMNVYNGNVQ